MIEKIKDLLTHPKIKGLDVNSSEIVDVSREILHSKKMFKQVITEFYNTCYNADKKYFTQEGKKLEIGAGVSFIKEIYLEVITSDIKKTSHLDLEIDALSMDFKNASIGAIYGLNCFHHLPNPGAFFKELDRVLVSGGGCVLIDPYHGPFSSFLYKRLFQDETFDKAQKNWQDPENEIMKGANQALSYIVFKRDLKVFNEQNPTLEIISQKPLNNYLRYLISGGLNFKALLPNFMTPVIRFIEFILIPINHLFALHQVIIIRKK
jgi:SAM-dependent methyltransferase